MKRRPIWLAALALSGAIGAHEIHVSPGGPVTTFEAARDAVRAWRAGEGRGKSEPVRVIVGAGTYTVSGPLVLDSRDGGTETSPVTWEAAPGARPVISGGRRITGWKVAAGGLWTTEVPGVGEGRWYFQELWVNGRRATRARTPNRGYFHAIRPALENHAGAPAMAKPEFTAFYALPSDVAPLSRLTGPQRDDAEVVVYQTWQIARHRIAFLDGAEGYLQFTAPSRWPFLLYEPRQRFVIENVESALDAPGEWFLSRTGGLSYRPLPGEDPAAAEVIAPVANEILAIRGEAAAGRAVGHLTFRGLAFRNSGFVLGGEGHVDSQADSKIGAAVTVDGARNVRFEACEIAHTGTYGLWFRKGCTDCAAVQCHVHDLGAGGVRIGETVMQPHPADRTHRVTVDNCIIQTGGRYFQGSVGVFIAHSGENSVTHNDIGDFFYTGVSAGWVWSYHESWAHRNRIDWNHIHHLGYGVLSDMGGFYGLGPASGTSVSNNHIHHVNGYRYGGWGLYTDEGSTGVLMENNLVHHTRHSTFHQHYGRDNIVRNNILAYGEEAQIQRSRAEEHLSFTYANNIVLFNSGTLHHGQWNKPRVRMERNLYWDSSKRPIEFGGQKFADWQKQGYDFGSRVADPLFLDADRGDFRLRPDSPALAMGFRPFDYSRAGVYGDASWKQLARALKPLEIEREEVPLFVLQDDFETTPPGRPIWNGHVTVEGGGDSIAVSEERAGSGRRSLKFQDAPGLRQRYNPHLNFDVNHHQGRSRVAFSIWLEPGAEFGHEWRDKRAPYRPGPSLEIRGGVLRAGQREIAGLEPGRWVRLEIRAALGDAGGGPWSLTVTPAGGAKREFPGLSLANTEWRDLEWLVFTSDGKDKAAIYIDDLEIGNDGAR